tara:strand:- start:607 stop:1032 length:426 start_codon:yes stop_codon:yes gene_type:complete
MAYRQTIVAKRLLAFVGPNVIKFYNKGGDYSKFIKSSDTNVTNKCVFEIVDPLEMPDILIEDIAQECDLQIDDVKSYIGNFRYEISDIMPVSLAVELAVRGYDSPVYGKSLISTGLAVTDLNKVILENDKVDQGEGADLAF